MPIPFLAVAIGAAVVGAIGIGVAAASSSGGPICQNYRKQRATVVLHAPSVRAKLNDCVI